MASINFPSNSGKGYNFKPFQSCVLFLRQPPAAVSAHLISNNSSVANNPRSTHTESHVQHVKQRTNYCSNGYLWWLNVLKIIRMDCNAFFDSLRRFFFASLRGLIEAENIQMITPLSPDQSVEPKHYYGAIKCIAQLESNDMGALIEPTYFQAAILLTYWNRTPIKDCIRYVQQQIFSFVSLIVDIR